MTVSEAMDFFVAHPNVRRPLSVLKEVGLDYLKLGQSANTLSGGEVAAHETRARIVGQSPAAHPVYFG